MGPAPGFLPRLLLKLLRLWLLSLRVRGPGPLPRRGVLALWHEDLPSCMAAFAGAGIHVLVSRSRDGGLAAALCESLGYRVHRGSSTRGALSGLKALARSAASANETALIGMALDGPRGPAHVAKGGAAWLARHCGLQVIPIHVRARFAFRINSWDRTWIPFPFSRVDVEWGPPVYSLHEEASLAPFPASP